MEVITGSKRENTLNQWKEQIKKCVGRANESAECFYRFSESSDLDHLIEDAEAIIKTAKNARQVLEFLNANNIK